MHTLRQSLLVVAVCGGLLGILAADAWAQDAQQPQQGQQTQGQQNQSPAPQGQQNEAQPAAPIPAYHSPLASEAGDDQSSEQTEPLAPDTRPLSGAQILSLGSLENDHSYWQPHADVAGVFDTNPQEGPNTSSWGAWASFSGGVDLHQISGNSDLTLSYLGGATIASGANASNGVVQQLGIVEALTFRRWHLSLIDQLSYLPGSGFGFGGLGSAGVSTGGSVGLGTTFGVPNETALTGLGQTLANASTAEATVNLTPRGSLTFVGGYSLVQYSTGGFVNSTEANFQGGYNYLLTRKDTVAVLYTYSAVRYGNVDQSIDLHTIQGSYARRITGRLAFQVQAGPQFGLFRTPISSGSGSTVGGATASSSTQFLWSLSSNMQYQLRRTLLALSYNHSVSAGAGVLAGSVANVVSGSVTRQMSQTFSSGLTAGYSRNNGLTTESAGSTTPTNQTYDYWFVGANFSRPLGRTLGLTFSYQLEYQSSDASFCIGPTCGTSVIRNLISVGLGWHERPRLF
ncbi:MAG: hypothetical protein WA369_05175 [Candidatus Acidiferrales bacterium]